MYAVLFCIFLALLYLQKGDQHSKHLNERILHFLLYLFEKYISAFFQLLFTWLFVLFMNRRTLQSKMALSLAALSLATARPILRGSSSGPTCRSLAMWVTTFPRIELHSEGCNCSTIDWRKIYGELSKSPIHSEREFEWKVTENYLGFALLEGVRLGDGREHDVRASHRCLVAWLLDWLDRLELPSTTGC